MSKKEKVDVSDWINKTKENLRMARTAFDEGLYNPSVFYCHQSVEMILKASWLAFLRRTPLTGRNGHNLFRLYPKNLQKRVKLTKRQIDFLIELTPHYLNTRYPELSFSSTRTYAKRCLRITEGIVKCFLEKLS